MYKKSFFSVEVQNYVTYQKNEILKIVLKLAQIFRMKDSFGCALNFQTICR